jgi:hypothetical protein
VLPDDVELEPAHGEAGAARHGTGDGHVGRSPITGGATLMPSPQTSSVSTR